MNLKKTIFIPLLLSACFLFGQSVEISPLAGYHLGGKARFVEGDIKLENQVNWGGVLSVSTRYGVWTELSYSYTNTKGVFSPSSILFEEAEWDLVTHYFQAGARKEFITDSPLRPFGMLAAGAAFFNNRDSEITDVWRFAVSLGGGAVIDLSERIGIRLQGRLLMPLYFSGGGVFCGIGTGGSNCGVSLNSTTTIVQGDFSGGIVISLGP